MIKKCRLQDVPGRATRARVGHRIADIEAFIASGDDCCEIVLKEGEKPDRVSTTYRNSIRKRQYYSDVCDAILRDGRVFLIRKEDKRIKEDYNAE